MPAFKPHEITALPKHYWKALVDYYYFVKSPPAEDDDSDGATIDFDQMSSQRRMTMKEKWGQEAFKGELT